MTDVATQTSSIKALVPKLTRYFGVECASIEDRIFNPEFRCSAIVAGLPESAAYLAAAAHSYRDSDYSHFEHNIMTGFVQISNLGLHSKKSEWPDEPLFHFIKHMQRPTAGRVRASLFVNGSDGTRLQKLESVNVDLLDDIVNSSNLVFLRERYGWDAVSKVSFAVRLLSCWLTERVVERVYTRRYKAVLDGFRAFLPASMLAQMEISDDREAELCLNAIWRREMQAAGLSVERASADMEILVSEKMRQIVLSGFSAVIKSNAPFLLQQPNSKH